MGSFRLFHGWRQPFIPCFNLFGVFSLSFLFLAARLAGVIRVFLGDWSLSKRREISDLVWVAHQIARCPILISYKVCHRLHTYQYTGVPNSPASQVLEAGPLYLPPLISTLDLPSSSSPV